MHFPYTIYADQTISVTITKRYIAVGPIACGSSDRLFCWLHVIGFLPCVSCNDSHYWIELDNAIYFVDLSFP